MTITHSVDARDPKEFRRLRACELNADEGVWGWLKNDMANICCRNLKQLKGHLRQSIRRLRNRTEVIFGFIKRTGLPLEL